MEYINLYKTAAENNSFLKTLFTHRKVQVAVSNLKSGQESGEEVWPVDLTVLVLWGKAHFVVGGESRDVEAGGLICIPANSDYFFVNLGTEPLKLLMVFSGAVFKDGTDQGSKISEIMDPYKIRL